MGRLDLCAGRRGLPDFHPIPALDLTVFGAEVCPLSPGEMREFKIALPGPFPWPETGQLEVWVDYYREPEAMHRMDDGTFPYRVVSRSNKVEVHIPSCHGIPE